MGSPLESIVMQLAEVEAALKAEQAEIGRGKGGQEVSYALTRIREARLFLKDAPVSTPFTEPVIGECHPPRR